MTKKRVAIIGGSIAGNTMAVLLERVGFEVIVLEKSSGISKQGTGITLPKELVEQCILLDLFDKNIPTLEMTNRSFLRKNSEGSTKFWTQPIHVFTLNWLHVYENLRKRIPKQNYHYNTQVVHIKKANDIFYIQTKKNITYEADYIIAADGVDSCVRQQVFPKINPNYAGYIAWRGLIECDERCLSNIEKDQIPYYVFKGGHILLYPIPATNYEKTRNVLLNWVMYQKRENEPLSELLKDKFGNSHTRSLPQDSISDEHIRHLHALASHALPKNIADLILKTRKPFIQAVFDLDLPPSPDSSILFIGDAAATLRPHTASGVLKALLGSIKFYTLYKTNKTKDFTVLSAEWQKNEQFMAQEESKKSIRMGEALVTKSPDWDEFDQNLTDRWWETVIQGMAWYVTNPNKTYPSYLKTLVFSRLDFCDGGLLKDE